MIDSKNIYIYDKTITIDKKPIQIVPEPGDNFIICKDRDDAYLKLIKYRDEFTLEYSHVIGMYSSEDLDKDVTDYQLCNRLSINGNAYNFIGIKVDYASVATARDFYLY